MSEDSVADGESRDAGTDLYDPAGGFVTQDGGCLPTDIPGEGVAGADPADRHLDEGVRGLKFGHGMFFDSAVV